MQFSFVAGSDVTPVNDPMLLRLLDTERVIEHPYVARGVVGMANPFIDDVLAINITAPFLIDRLGRPEAERIMRKFAHRIERVNLGSNSPYPKILSRQCLSVGSYLQKDPNNLLDLFFDASSFLTDPEEVQLLLGLGYDGARCISGSYGPGVLEYFAFKPEQIIVDSIRENYTNSSPSLIPKAGV